MFVNKFVDKVKPYQVTSHQAWEKLDKGEAVLKLDWNEATIPPAPMVVEQLQKFIATNRLNWYPNVHNLALLKALVKYTGMPMENIQYYASSDAIHEYIVRAYIDPGDRILIVSPTYDNFRASAESLGGTIIYYYLDDDFQLNKTSFYAYLSQEKPKIVYICNPNNPTGTVYSLEFLQEMITRFTQTFFIVDEAYFEFTNVTVQDLVKTQQNLIITRTFSKAFALAGFRIGYMLASKENVEILNRIRNAKNISSLSQIAAIAALENIKYTNEYITEVLAAKEFFLEGLKKFRAFGLTVYAGGGNFLLIKLPLEKKIKLIEFLAEQNIYIRDYGHVFKMSEFVRITIGTQKQMQLVLQKIMQFCEGK